MTTEVRRGRCSYCGTDRRLRIDGTVVRHSHADHYRCPGSVLPPAEAEDWESRARRAEAVLVRVQDVPTHLAGGRVVVHLADLNRALGVPDG